ncbi:MAG: glycine cleavage system aminomethyltransferase GcvT, partial [Anaerolineae bacterium]|nr:glycine cleavage system aminomethyltransferase GcvT [Anaerolineae bacterium]
DVWRKVQGPVKVEVIGDRAQDGRIVTVALAGPQAEEKLRRVLGPAFPDALAGTTFGWARVPYADRTVLVSRRCYASGAVTYGLQGSIAPLQAVWDALVQAQAVVVHPSLARSVLRAQIGLPVRWPEKAGGVQAVESYPYLFSLHKSYFVGQGSLPRPQEGGADKRAFAWSEAAGAPLKRTPLYEEHKAMGARLIAFAGWEMPVWYSSVGEEHRAVREAAGLFDVAHMGTLEVSGPHAADFLDMVSTNYVRRLQDGRSHYSTMLDVEGGVLDDIMVYRRAWDRYFVVVNAANFDKDWAWLNAVNNNEVVVDKHRPWVRVLHPAVLRNLHDPSGGPDCRVDIALQGPASRDILLACANAMPGHTDAGLRVELERMRRTDFVEARLGGLDLLIARTGYTGEEMGFELYVHPDQAVALWRMLMTHGKAYGIVPCGLAARDSTRIEAGLPLYGHELGGPLSISPTEAGFAGYVKYHKPFFAGRTPYKAYHDQSKRQVIRFQVCEKGARAIRGGEHGEPVVNKRGRVIGRVTSCTLIGDVQIGLALVDDRYTEAGTELSIYPETRKAVAKVPEAFELGDTVPMAVDAVVIDRFPGK